MLPIRRVMKFIVRAAAPMTKQFGVLTVQYVDPLSHTTVYYAIIMIMYAQIATVSSKLIFMTYV